MPRCWSMVMPKAGPLIADHEDIFIKILTVVGVMEWVCLGVVAFLFVIEPFAQKFNRRARAALGVSVVPRQAVFGRRRCECSAAVYFHR